MAGRVRSESSSEASGSGTSSSEYDSKHSSDSDSEEESSDSSGEEESRAQGARKGDAALQQFLAKRPRLDAREVTLVIDPAALRYYFKTM
jgi:hypothetical protein